MPTNNQSDGETNESLAKRKERGAKAIFPREVLDQLLKGYSKPEDLTGPEGLLKQLTAALVE